MAAAPRTLREGRYTLNRTIGSGSQAETFEARDHGIARGRPAAGDLAADWQRYVSRARRGETPNPEGLVAIKAFHVGKAKAWKDVELAEREARTLSSLSHPNLPRYIEHFEEDGALYLVMEMIEGETLAALRAKQRGSSVAEVTRMIADIAEALRYLHGRAPAVVHRDIKPGNIIRRPDGSYTLVDFGAVRDRLKPEGGSTVVGTFGYMAPEQFQGRASTRSDLYGLGATALVMLTGVEPEDLPHVGLRIDVARALPTGTPRPLVRALEAMLDPDPDQRVASIDEALALLREAPPRQAQAARAAQPARAAPAEPVLLTKKERREASRAARRERRALARSRRPPFVPRVVGQVGLFVAWLAVWLTVGLAVPLVLVLLSLIFGARLRSAAAATRAAAVRARRALGRSAAWLAGYRGEEALAAAHVRVEGVEPRLRVGHDLAERDENAEERDDAENENETETETETVRRSIRRS